MAVARITEISASSKKSFEAAVAEGVGRANDTLRGVTGAWVQDQEVVVVDGRITEYRVKLKVTFILEG
ncbi:MAG: dodecin domain-containing protein [Gammaproteobacteria bacterium]|nr:dodecin family protein [Gammaproteobacteria bacterium]NNL99767.1 dodecin domain-containing protein [Gammaproteobacteria bacterium]